MKPDRRDEWDLTDRAERDAVDRCQDRPEKEIPVLPEDHEKQRRHRPDENIKQAPGADAVDEKLQDHEADHRIESLPAVQHDRQDQEHCDRMHVRNVPKRLFSTEHQRAEDCEFRDLIDGQPPVLRGLTALHGLPAFLQDQLVLSAVCDRL